MNTISRRWYALSTYFRRRFGRRIQKIPLDAGFSCPNRDGTLSADGCLFCNPRGSGTGLHAAGLSLAEQWEHWRARYAKKHPNAGYLAYLQAFSNTHGPLSRIAAVLDELAACEGLVGLSLGTRPDCLDADKIALLAEQPWSETWLELGLQTASDATLDRINRGHDAACFARATEEAAAAGLNICAHVIAGLPGEGADDFQRTIDFVNALPVAGIKLHGCYVCAGTALETLYRAGGYEPLTRTAYAAMVRDGLAALRPEIVVQRLTGDPAPGELVAPAWAADKRATMAAIERALAKADAWQGKRFHSVAPPAWFEPDPPSHGEENRYA
jgi:radical SAM protein (TIGR01212 family)